MADGSSRSTATQTSLLKCFEISPSAWSQCPKCRNTEYPWLADKSGSEIEIKQAFAAEQIASLSTFPSNEAGSRATQSDGHGQGQSLLENGSARMRDSPTGSINGNTNQDRTPRVRPADSPRSYSPLHNLSNSTTSPNRQDSAYESIKGYQDEESRVDVDVQAGNIRARKRLETLRGRVSRTRRVLSESRQDVQFLREKLRDATARLMRAIDELMARDNFENLRSLSPFYEATRIAQDELGPVEDSYDILEMRLNREEEELEQEEVHFYTHNNIVLAPPPDSKLDEPLTPLRKPYRPDDVQFQDLDLDNELVKQYLEKVAEAESLKEEIYDLESEQYGLIEELAFRTRYNLKLSEGKSAFMFNYPQKYKELTETLQSVENDLYDLRDSCIEQKLFGVTEHVYEPRDALVEDIYDSMNEALDRLPLRTAADHAASPRQHSTDFTDKREFVNTWLLELVQDSPVEALRLRMSIVLEYEKEGKELKGEEWPALVLGWWNRDHAGEEANEKHVLSTMDAIRGGTSHSRGSDGSLDVDLGEGERIEIEIMGSETGSYRTQKGDQERMGTSDQEKPEKKQSEEGLVVRTRASSVSKASSV